jgi:hypothetical protein
LITTTIQTTTTTTTSDDPSLFDTIRNVGYSAWNSATSWVTCYFG